MLVIAQQDPAGFLEKASEGFGGENRSFVLRQQVRLLPRRARGKDRDLVLEDRLDAVEHRVRELDPAGNVLHQVFPAVLHARPQ